MEKKRLILFLHDQVKSYDCHLNFAEVLKSHGYEILEVDKTLQAIYYLYNHNLPDCILFGPISDPENLETLLQDIKTNSTLEKIPVFVLPDDLNKFLGVSTGEIDRIESMPVHEFKVILKLLEQYGKNRNQTKTL